MCWAGLEKTASDVGSTVMQLLKQSPDITAPIAQNCLKLLAQLLHSCSTYKVCLLASP